ncbi:TPA: hypothetical protein RG752_002770, partial [Enterococcus faecalis]|nr:hypothetical protein [Enterococcus faecalis]
INYINENLSEDNFAMLILKNQINKNDLLNYQNQQIDFLISNNVISVNKKGFLYLTPKQSIRIIIFSNLYKFGVIHYYYAIDNMMKLKLQQSEIDSMISEDILTYESTLFSKPEADFLNYILNNSEFDNALGLRNKYLHGSVVDDNYADYLYSLMILVIYTIQINNELTLNNEFRDNYEQNATNKKDRK